MADLMLIILVYEETMNFMRFVLFFFYFLGVEGTVGALLGGWEAADEQQQKVKIVIFYCRFS